MSEWISVKNGRLPSIAESVILCLKGVVQKETYYLDVSDNDFNCEYFWARDDLEDCPRVTDDDLWMPLPKAPDKLMRDK